MKVLAIHDKPRGEMGGMNTFIAAQNALFERAGWSVSEIVCTPEPQPGITHLSPSGRRSGLQAARALREMIAEARPDVVMAHSVYYALGPMALHALQDMVPSVYVLHDVTPLCPRATRLTRGGELCNKQQGLQCVSSGCYRAGEHGRWASDAYGLLTRALQMGAARSVRQWVVPSRYLASLLQSHGIAADRIAVIPHFVDGLRVDGYFKPDAQPVPGRLLYAGRLVPEKGISRLLEALRSLADLDWSLHISGNGPEREALQQVVAQRGWADRVSFVEAHTPQELAEEYQQAAVVVMPSLIPESFGLVGLEAMLYARPVAGFASGGMAEWLRDGVTGRVADWGDASSLARALRDLLTQPHVARQLGERGREIALREFSAAAHFQRMRDLLTQVVAQHNVQPALQAAQS